MTKRNVTKRRFLKPFSTDFSKTLTKVAKLMLDKVLKFALKPDGVFELSRKPRGGGQNLPPPQWGAG